MTTAVRQTGSSSPGSATTGPSLEMPHTDHHPTPYHGLSRAEVLAMRREYCNPAIFTLYKEPLMIVEGYMQYLYDETGRRYLDMLAGYSALDRRRLDEQRRPPGQHPQPRLP